MDENASLLVAIKFAQLHLPRHYTTNIFVCNGEVNFMLEDPDGHGIYVDLTNLSMAESVKACVAKAINYENTEEE